MLTFLKRAACIGALLLIAWHLWLFAHVLWWNWYAPGETSFMALRLDELREKNPQAKLTYQWMPYAKISSHLKRAVVAAEDDSFVDHDGFDWERHAARD